MTTDLIFNTGEELLVKEGFDGKTVTVGLYNDSVDNLGEFAALSNINTEPSIDQTNYSRESITLSASENQNNNFVGENSEQILFNFEDIVQGSANAQDVDAAFVVYNDPNNSNFNDILLANPSMTTIRNTAAFDELEISPGDFGIGVDGTANTSG